jgi:hypothetical protein
MTTSVCEHMTVVRPGILRIFIIAKEGGLLKVLGEVLLARAIDHADRLGDQVEVARTT